MLDHLPKEVLIAIATIVSLFALSLLCLCWILRCSAKNGNEDDPFRRGHRQRHGAEDKRCFGIRCSSCCCGCVRTGMKRDSATTLREFDSLNELVFEIDGRETARLTNTSETRNDDTATAGVYPPDEVSMDTLFPKLLQGHKVASATSHRREHGNHDVGATAAELEEPLL